MTIIYYVVGVIFGIVGYLAFGSKSNAIILINMPTNNWVGTTAKIFYTFTIMGSFAIVIQPIYNIIENY